MGVANSMVVSEALNLSIILREGKRILVPGLNLGPLAISSGEEGGGLLCGTKA